MKSTIFSLVFAIVIVTAPMTARAAMFQDPAVQERDHTLRERIEARVQHDAALKTRDVKVSVDGGVAILTGTVATSVERTHAARLARVPGISRVDNQIVVDRSITRVTGAKGALDNAKDAAKAVGGAAKDGAVAVGEKTKDGAVTVGEKTKDGAVTVGEKTKDGAVTVGEKTKDGAVAVTDKVKDAAVTVSDRTKDGTAKAGEKTVDGVNKASGQVGDTAIIARVKARFVGEELLKGSEIKVDSNQYVVTLRGFVTSRAGKDRAVEIASGTDGVQRVVDELTIGPKG